MSGLDGAKRAAAWRAAARIESGAVLGLGSGSTALYFVEALAERCRSGLSVVGVPTSVATKELAISLGLPLTDLESRPRLDLDVDGADEIDPALNAIKGGGGAFLHEKIVALASDRLVLIADESKLVPRLGTTRGIPVEVVAFGWRGAADAIASLGAAWQIRGGDRPYVTESGNFIIDVMPPTGDLFAFVDAVKQLTGVVEHGVFRHLAAEALIGYADGSVRTLSP